MRRQANSSESSLTSPLRDGKINPGKMVIFYEGGTDGKENWVSTAADKENRSKTTSGKCEGGSVPGPELANGCSVKKTTTLWPSDEFKTTQQIKHVDSRMGVRNVAEFPRPKCLRLRTVSMNLTV